MQAAVLALDSGLAPLLPITLRGYPIVYTWTEGATLKYAIEALGAPHTGIGQVLVDGRIMVLEALSPARGHVAVLVMGPFLPATPPHFLCDVHLGAAAHLLRTAGSNTAYDSNHAGAVIETLAYEEDQIVLSCDRELLKRHGVWRGAFIRAREPQAQIREIVTRLQFADVAKPSSHCLECDVLSRMLSPGEASASVLSRVCECQWLFSACDIYHHVY